MNQITSPNASEFGTFADFTELSIEEVVAIQEATQDDVTTEPAVNVTELQAVPKQPSTPEPLPKFPPLKRRMVSGRYRSVSSPWILELRVDVDGVHPLLKVSGDYFYTTGKTTSYFGSFIVDSPKLLGLETNQVIILGAARCTWSESFSTIQVTIPRAILFLPPANATVRWFNAQLKPGTTYLCNYESPYFRSVQYELDYVADETTPLFQDYDTGSLASGGAARKLSVVKAYREAGIELLPTTATDVIPVSEEGTNIADSKWDDTELHASMEKHFSLWKDVPQWGVWEVACWEHVMGSGLLGIMFDQQGSQRQGCAVFYKGMSGVTPEYRRTQLYCHVHELGHCFNLLHSWQKEYANPPSPVVVPPQKNSFAALSWMDYPWYYNPGSGNPTGEAAFWNAFPFQFVNAELIHLRHAFRNDIIMGGNPFATGSALENVRAFADPIEDNSGLKFTISMERSNKSFLFGEPVHIKLTLTGQEGRAVHPYLHPSDGLVQIGICRPDGEVFVYRPLIEHCVAGQVLTIGPESPSLGEVVYCGFGKDGFYFDRTGFYQIRAIYNAPDGSQVLSNILHFRVAHPVTPADEEVADLFFGQQQGTLLCLNGSDSEFLAHGNDCFETVLEKYPDHPLATYARYIKGMNAARTFKLINTQERTVKIRPAKPQEATTLLKAVVEASDPHGILDMIPMDKTLEVLSETQRAIGKTEEADATQKRSKTFGRKPLAGTRV
jgi:hypothetical protein